MRRHTVTLVVLVPLAAALVAGCGGGKRAIPPAHDLTGTWTNSAGGGTTLVLTQHGSTLTWVGGPNDKAWVQFFNGKVVGDGFSGTFAQDAPGTVPQRFHGSMQAQINDNCHFTFTKIAQRGEPVLSNVVFTKATCGQAQPTLTVSLAQGQLTPKVSSGARVTFCNDGTAVHTLSTTTPGNAFREAKMKAGTCFTKQFVNTTNAPLDVTIHGRTKNGPTLQLVVEPKP